MSLTEQYPFCEICPIIENPDPQEADFRIHEGEFWRVSLRDNQALLGTSFITLKYHKGGLEELSLDEDDEFRDIRNRLIGALGVAFKPDVVNLSCLMNLAFKPPTDKLPTDDPPEFVPQPHVHWHLKPRYSKSRRVEEQVFSDPEFGGYLRIARSQKVSPELGRLIAGRIKENF